MKNITIFANCQGEALAKFLRVGLPPKEWQIEYFSNNPRRGDMKSLPEIIAGIKKSDVLIYQPLGAAHGELSDFAIKQIVREGASQVSFPYIFNSGTYSMDRNPHHAKSSYGIVYGEEYIIPLLKENNFSDVIELYQNGQINFDLKNRFHMCITMMKNREMQTIIKLSAFIIEHYQAQKLFLTHNHPTTIVFLEICAQLKKLLNIPFSDSAINTENENWANLPLGEVPISPYDVKVHDYHFDYDKNWHAKGIRLLKFIANDYYADKIIKDIDDITKMMKSEQFEEAQKILSSALSKYPESPDLYVLEGELLFYTGALHEAERIFAEIIRVNPKHIRALNGIACVKIVGQKWAEAMNFLHRVLQVDVDCVDARENLKFLQNELKSL